MKNYGLINEEPTPEQLLGAPGEQTILQADRNWTLSLPPLEAQKKKKDDTWACTIFSGWNCVETGSKREFGMTLNKSDRMTAKLSGNQPFVGNTIQRSADSICKDWSVNEAEYPFTDNMTIEEYYQDVPVHLIEKARKEREFIVDNYWVAWGGCDPYKLWDTLQYNPIQVTLYAWESSLNGIYHRVDTDYTNHAVMLFRGKFEKFWWIYDHYDESIKQLSWDYYFGVAKKFVLKRTFMMKLVKGDQQPNVYAIDKDGKRRYIYDEVLFEKGRDKGIWGNWNEIQVQSQASVEATPEGMPINEVMLELL